MDDKKLTQEQETLLSRYHDGECNWLTALQAKRLIARSVAASNFLVGLAKIAECAKAQPFKSEIDSNALWHKVRMRIEQEERSAVFLGNRQAAATQRPADRRTHGLAWGMSGGLVAAGLVFMMVRNPAPQPVRANQEADLTTEVAPQIADLSAPIQVNTVQYGGAPTARSFAAPPAFSEDQLGQVVEVDWMRSDGSLRLLQDPSEKSAIIWVKRRPKREQIFEGPNKNGVRILNEKQR